MRLSQALPGMAFAATVTAKGLIPDQPAATIFANQPLGDGWTPKPTEAPSVAQVELRKRQTLASGSICGYVQSDTLSCSFGRTCGLYTASDMYGMVGCYSGDDYDNGWASTCYDYVSQVTCTGACASNPLNLRCTDVASPFCYSMTYSDYDARAYGCGVSYFFASTYLDLSQTTTVGGGTTAVALPFVETSGIESLRSRGQQQTRQATSRASSFRSTSTGSSTYTYYDSSSGTTRALSIGGIIGVSITAVGILAIIIGAFCVCRQRKKKQKRIAAASQIPLHFAVQQQQQPLMSGGPPAPPAAPDNNPHLGAAGYYAGQAPELKLSPSMNSYAVQNVSPLSSPPATHVAPAVYPQRHPSTTSDVSNTASPANDQPYIRPMSFGASPISPENSGPYRPSPAEMMSNAQVQRPVEIGENVPYQPARSPIQRRPVEMGATAPVQSTSPVQQQQQYTAYSPPPGPPPGLPPAMQPQQQPGTQYAQQTAGQRPQGTQGPYEMS